VTIYFLKVQLVPGQSTRIWPQEDRTDAQQQQQQQQQQGMFETQQPQQPVAAQQAVPAAGDSTFRQPLPPGMRPRAPLGPQSMLIRGQTGVSYSYHILSEIHGTKILLLFTYIYFIFLPSQSEFFHSIYQVYSTD
jgi:hypothetical protein